MVGAVALLVPELLKNISSDDNSRVGPDHGFAMNPKTWKQEMVEVVRELERALGNGIKKVEENEKNTVIILQRRSLRAKKKILIGEKTFD